MPEGQAAMQEDEISNLDADGGLLERKSVFSLQHFYWTICLIRINLLKDRK